MQTATLDTSCAQNFLSVTEQADLELIEVVRAGLTHQIDLKVSEAAFDEVARTPDVALRSHRLARLRAFGPVELPASRRPERDALADQLLTALFPHSQAGTTTFDHNHRDCIQLATHKLIGRDVFITRDRALRERAADASAFGIVVRDPAQALRELKASWPAVPDLASVTLRGFDPARDEAAVRDVLDPLAADYPAFHRWLDARFADRERTRITVGELRGEVSAAAVVVRKDDRVLKLAAFYVAPHARNAALGSHLLWSELRRWIHEGHEKVIVTISSRHADLLSFFAGFGFLVEGVSPRRYQDDTAEYVLSKHLLRERVDTEGLESFAASRAPLLFVGPRLGRPPARFWSWPGRASDPEFRWSGRSPDPELTALEDGAELIRWSIGDLERTLHPARFALDGRRALVVPIDRVWADALVEYVGQQRELERPGEATRLLLRPDNAYYAYPKSMEVARPGAPILLYVSEPVSAVIGEATLLEVERAEPDDLYLRFGGLGIYRPEQIRMHVMRSGPHAGKAVALHFGRYVPYPSPVTHGNMSRVLGRRFNPQGLTPVSYEDFERVRRTGGVQW